MLLSWYWSRQTLCQHQVIHIMVSLYLQMIYNSTAFIIIFNIKSRKGSLTGARLTLNCCMVSFTVKYNQNFTVTGQYYYCDYDIHLWKWSDIFLISEKIYNICTKSCSSYLNNNVPILLFIKGRSVYEHTVNESQLNNISQHEKITKHSR